ncbi:bifunctional 4-hydroxy-2-oxoglutarate aldolase/2-dehydro-3-deoxy-phosphogluconate aldolase [Pasteurella canis]|uniref:2-dehydro-3-deoxy-phosphogluconate aldolase n=1 Tax=Pasteurella canis TaxID=753 RepID=A0ABQ4VDQ7_9PAST|nr:bifunctional 4-hydroxy-2-oxoglutarate aldolase/2-dehydro-3-deoxy-phosphogluconate aldolase [Pasteurella canis]UEC23521.1 bifunctional 4-hydroxy-2-oxoglutarate aldolase/2-dehydro-3-deoxy-phosphogluconate aldolase [Pasteurella canis]GJH42051.1 putative KHG/KDPG aldolase [Pasteurella canis]
MRYNHVQLIEKLRQLRIIPVIALEQAEDIIPLAETLVNNGLPVVEITFRSTAAVQAIQLLRERKPDILIAAGTVLTTEQVVQAKKAGVDCIVTPGFNPKIVQLCQNLDLPIIPGVNNPMAIEAVLAMGIDTVKFFPAQASGGVGMIKALLGPYSMLQIMPTGGINLNNLQDYLSIPNVIACGGSWFVESTLIKAQNWNEIGRLTREVVASIR